MFDTLQEYIDAGQARQCVNQFVNKPSWWVTTDGRVWKVGYGWFIPCKSKNKFRVGFVTPEGKSRTVNLAVLLLYIFKPDSYFDGAQGLHKNDIPTDDRIENLYWGTDDQNKADALLNGGTLRGVEARKITIREIGLFGENWSKIMKEAHEAAGWTKEKYAEVIKAGKDRIGWTPELASELIKEGHRQSSEETKSRHRLRVRGNNSAVSVLTEALVRDMYVSHRRDGVSAAELAEKAGVNSNTVTGMLLRRTWIWLTDIIDAEFGFEPIPAQPHPPNKPKFKKKPPDDVLS